MPYTNNATAQVTQQFQTQSPLQTGGHNIGIARTENLGKGILGALLLGLAGVAIYIGIYQLGYILFASGVIIFNLCMFGYNKFSGHDASQYYSKKGVLVCGIIALLVMILSEYFCIAIEIFKSYKGYGITFLESVGKVPQALSDKDILLSCLKDVGISFVVFVVFFFMTLFGTRQVKQRTPNNRAPAQQMNYQPGAYQQQQYQPQQYQSQQYQP